MTSCSISRLSSIPECFAGQSHLIFETGSTGCVTPSQLSKLCYAGAHYKPPENLDAIALECFGNT
jgi:hypothetical protein